MEIKYNESTELRPQGERVIDAPLVKINITKFIKQLKSESAWKKNDRNAMTVYKADGMRIVLMALHKKAKLKRHTADGIISVQLLQGKITFATDDKSVELKKGQMITLHKKVPHSVTAIKKSVFLLTVAISSEK